MRLTINNNTSQKLTFTIEPWGRLYTLDPGSCASLEPVDHSPDSQQDLFEIIKTPDCYIIYATDYIRLFINEKSVDTLGF